MAMITCKDCGEQISDKAICCPKCGCPVVKEQKKKILLIVSAIIATLFVAGIVWYAVDERLIFLSSDSRMEYYFYPVKNYSMDLTEESRERAIEYFNKKYVGTAKEDAAVEMFKSAVTDYFEFASVVSGDCTYAADFYYEIATGLDTDNADITLLCEVMAFLSNAVSTGEIENSPSEYVGECALVSDRLHDVDSDRESIWLGNGGRSLECFYKSTLIPDEISIAAYWDNNRSRAGGNVLAFGFIREYRNTNDAYMDMVVSVDLITYDGWEKIEAINEFKEGLEGLGYRFE